ncbi:hypothetical protein [Colwellia piezophila]|uniref:hypothetical protein n=1 Tax=Colwellia piezophila TaxID=211668 RepID=UPI000376C1B5|nr:hypothetical protein [Colwellia piezophila]
MENLIRFMQKHSTGKLVFVLFLLTMAVYSTMLLYSIPAVTAFTPELPIFDLSPLGYSFNYANELLNTLGTEGRNLYLTTQLPLDFIYPGLFSLTYSLMLVWLFGKTFNGNSKVYYFSFVPFLAGIFDYAENVFIIKMINSFPDLQVTTVKVASIFTLLKSSFTMLFFILLIVGFALLLKQNLSNIRR